MTRNTGYALLAALTAVVAVIASAIFIGVDRTSRGPSSELTQNRPPANRASAGHWVGTWATSMVATEPGTARRAYPRFSLRNVVHTSVGGTRTRVHLSNVFGERPLTVRRSTVALAAAPGSPDMAPGTMRPLTFGGKRSVTIAPGRSVTSDAVRLRVPDSVDLLVSGYLPATEGGVSYHPHARQTSYAAPGDHADDLAGAAFTERTPCWRLVSGVDVWTTASPGTLVALGDSITDGIRSTADANRRWTDFLADRLQHTRGAPRLGVANHGISGNRVLQDGTGRDFTSGPSGLNRLRRDVLSSTGASTVVIALGVNDILRDPGTADPVAIVDGLRMLTDRARARGLRVVGATLTPFGGHRGHTPQREAVRQRINAEIRSGSVFDSVVDFDAALRDPAAPERLRPQYDCGDHLHPSDAGNQALADAFDLGALRVRPPVTI